MTMDCGDFLAEYTEFRDGELSWDRREAFQAHLDACRSCARYDRVVRQGTELFRELPELEVSEDFAERLQHRLYHVDEERSYAGRRASARTALATLSAAAMIALAAWVPLALQRSPAPEPVAPLATSAAELYAFPYHSTLDPVFGEPGLTARLEEVGVQVYPLPYRDLVYGRGSVATFASFGGDHRHD